MQRSQHALNASSKSYLNEELKRGNTPNGEGSSRTHDQGNDPTAVSPYDQTSEEHEI